MWEPHVYSLMVQVRDAQAAARNVLDTYAGTCIRDVCLDHFAGARHRYMQHRGTGIHEVLLCEVHACGSRQVNCYRRRN